MGISRSSVQRYCEQGELRSHTTLGGHRRIEAEDVSRWLSGRTNKSRRRRKKQVTDTRFSPQYTAEALLTGKTHKLSPLLERVFLGTEQASWLIDQFLSPAMAEIGQMWASQQINYIDERRASTNLKFLFRQILQSKRPIDQGLRAIGASLEGDLAELASMAMEIVASESGFEAFHVGSNLPPRTLVEIASQIEANVVWVSYSHIQNLDETLEQNQLISELLPASIPLVVGGKSLTPHIVKRLDFNHYGRNCTEFASILDQVKQNASQGKPEPQITPPPRAAAAEH